MIPPAVSRTSPSCRRAGVIAGAPPEWEALHSDTETVTDVSCLAEPRMCLSKIELIWSSASPSGGKLLNSTKMWSKPEQEGPGRRVLEPP